MIHRYLGTPIDIHGGGADLIFPHHENETAQAMCAWDRPLANTVDAYGHATRRRGEDVQEPRQLLQPSKRFSTGIRLMPCVCSCSRPTIVRRSTSRSNRLDGTVGTLERLLTCVKNLRWMAQNRRAERRPHRSRSPARCRRRRDARGVRAPDGRRLQYRGWSRRDLWSRDRRKTPTSLTPPSHRRLPACVRPTRLSNSWACLGSVSRMPIRMTFRTSSWALRPHMQAMTDAPSRMPPQRFSMRDRQPERQRTGAWRMASAMPSQVSVSRSRHRQRRTTS